jgi:hypothetical protein
MLIIPEEEKDLNKPDILLFLATLISILENTSTTKLKRIGVQNHLA